MDPLLVRFEVDQEITSLNDSIDQLDSEIRTIQQIPACYLTARHCTELRALIRERNNCVRQRNQYFTYS